MTENEYRAMNERIAPGPVLEARTLERMEEARRAGKSRRPVRRVLAAALAVVLVLGLAVGAGAAGYGPIARLFAPILGGEESQIELIERLGQPIEGVSDTQAGITISADAMVSDGETFVILYTFSRENGEPLIPADAEPGGMLLFDSMGDGAGMGGEIDPDYDFEHPVGLGGSRMNDFLDLAPGEKEAHYVGTYRAPQGYPKTFVREVAGMTYWCGEYYGTPVPLVHKEDIDADTNTRMLEGYDLVLWRLKIPLPQGQESMTRDLDCEGDTFSLNGQDFVMTGVRVSPLYLSVGYEVTSVKPSEYIVIEKIEELEGGGRNVYFHYDDGPFLDNMSLTLRKKDGTEIDMTYSQPDRFGGTPERLGYAFSTWNGTAGYDNPDWNDPHFIKFLEDDSDEFICGYGGALPEIIPLEDMDCVIFNGIEYPVNP